MEPFYIYNDSCNDSGLKWIFTKIWSNTIQKKHVVMISERDYAQQHWTEMCLAEAELSGLFHRVRR